MHDPELQRLIESAWRGGLSQPEQAQLRKHLAKHPDARARWDQEMALTRGLNNLPRAPISSNFTALVMQAVQKPRRRRLDFGAFFPTGWMPRVALGAAMVCVSFLTIREYQQVQREHLARDLASVSQLAALPPVDWLQDFETINRLNRVKVADEDLLTVLQ